MLPRTLANFCLPFLDAGRMMRLPEWRIIRKFLPSAAYYERELLAAGTTAPATVSRGL